MTALALVGMSMLAGGLSAGCEGAGDKAEQFLRRHASSRGKAGTLRALEVAGRAHHVARAHAQAAEAACRLRPPRGAYTYEATLLVERSAEGEQTMRWRETRTTMRDSDGALQVSLTAEATTELGLTSEKQMAWRLVDQTSYVSADGTSYYAREASSRERQRLEQVGLASLQTLLDAAPQGWHAVDGAERRFAVGGERLVCGPADSLAAGWLRRLGAQATVVSGTLEASHDRVGSSSSPTSRTLELRWQLEDAQRLTARFEDRLSIGAPSIGAPDSEAIVDVERDRSLAAMQATLEDLAQRGAIERLVEREDTVPLDARQADDEEK